jgi:hypothetical protein
MGKKFVEHRNRGFFGWVFLTIFWVANGLMALWLAAVIIGWGGQMEGPLTDAEKAGAGIGIAIGLGVIFWMWVVVAAVTGLFVLMTRGRKEIIEIET